MISSKRSIYPPKLEEYIKANKVIPRKIREGEHLKLYHKYWIDWYDDILKVLDIYYIDSAEYYVTRDTQKLHGCITYPIDHNNTYEMLHNKYNIEEKNIINDNISYSGADIKYWFSVNDINLATGEKYSGFWSFLSYGSKNYLMDSKYYFVSYKENRRQRCQIILDKSKL